jgi:Putative porin
MMKKTLTQQQLRSLIAGAATFILTTQVGVANADERESLEQLRATTTNLIDLLVQEGVLNKDKADAIVKKATTDAANQVKKAKAKEVADALAIQENPELAGALAPKQDPKSVRVQYVPEHVKKEMRDEIQKEVMAKLNYKAGTRLGMPEWIDRIEWYGSTRLRYQLDQFDDDNPLPVFFNNDPLRNSGIENTTETRNRLRIRQLLGANININDWLSGGVRLTTGNLRDPGTANQDLELSDSKFTVGLDRAFLQAKLLPNLTVNAGRYAKPWFSTDLIFDDDLPFDGVAVNYMPKFNDKWSGFATVAAVPLEEFNQSDTRLSKDKWMYGAQAGVEWKIPKQASVKLGLAYYDYSNIEGISNGTSLDGRYDGSVPAFRQKGNNTFNINEQNGLDPKYALASEFQLVNFTGQVDYAKFDPIHVILLADYVKNIGFDQKEILARTGNLYKEETDAYNIRLTVGMPKMEKAHDWQVFGAYKRLEADSVVDGYTDQNFHLGGTDAKGWILGGSYGLDKNTWITARWFTADEVSGLPDQLPFSVDSFIVDLNAKF